MPDMTDEIRKAIKAQLVARPKPKSRPNVHRLTTGRKRKSAGIWSRPWEAESLGVNANQANDLRNLLKSHGITAEVDNEGNCTVTSERQFRQVAKARGLLTGRDGYGAESESGFRMLTGRQQAEGQARLRREIEKYESTVQ